MGKEQDKAVCHSRSAEKLRQNPDFPTNIAHYKTIDFRNLCGKDGYL
ncbi:hypothetical protein [Sporosarcina sp. FSL K6-2383]